MSLPKWAFPEASELASKLREQGEGQTAEFKEQFPEQAHRLGEEIAAFATSGGGTILIGVHNNGDVAGLEAATEDDRDKAIHRAQSILRTVDPSVKGSVSPASDDDKLVLVIEIGEQAKPVFYYDGRPYIREGRESRRATPDEVQACVWKHGSSDHHRELEELDLESKRQEAQRRNRDAERQQEWSEGLQKRHLGQLP